MMPSMPTDSNGKVGVGLASGVGGQIMQVLPNSGGRRMPLCYIGQRIYLTECYSFVRSPCMDSQAIQPVF